MREKEIVSVKLGISGLVDERTGIGVVQRHLYPELCSRGIELVESPSREYSGGIVSRIGGLLRGLTPAKGRYSAYLGVTPPTPFFVKAPMVTIVHDLRWIRTRNIVGRTYRKIDLAHAVRSSSRLVCISERTKKDLLEMFPNAERKIIVANLGPGNMPEGSFADQSNGLVLLMGGAPHKRNEIAAKALATGRPAWCRGVIGVNLSDEARMTLDGAFGAANNSWFSRPSDKKLIELYRRSEYFLFLGVEEGFGLPYIEALSAGCNVIAVDQPLTRDLLGGGAVLLQDGGEKALAEQLASIHEIDAEVRKERSAQYSWSSFAEAIVGGIGAVVTN